MTIDQASQVPEHLRQVNREVNLLWYEPSTILVAKEGPTELGAIRYALRHDPALKHGLLADLQVSLEVAKDEQAQIAAELIQAAEQRLREQGLGKMDAVVLDGAGRTMPYQNAGYWPWRKTVVVEWDLAKVPTQVVAESIRIEQPSVIDVSALFDLVTQSYQPYWQWWMEEHIEKPWLRTDFPGQKGRGWKATVGQKNKALLRQKLSALNPDTHPAWLAYRDGKLIGMVDAMTEGTEHFEFGVLVKFRAGGAGIGGALMIAALKWLKSKSLAAARITTTSGMEDYDPTVYLYTQALGGKFVAEYLDLVKKV